MRFYAGLYFLYRVVAFLAYMHSQLLPPVFLAVLLLGIHLVLQPYKPWKHNIINTLIFLDIAAINSMTEMIKSSLITGSNNNIVNLKLIQLALIYMPMMSLLLIIFMKVGQKIVSLCRLSRRIIREPIQQPSVGQIGDRDAESETEFPLAQLEVPLLL